MQSAGLPAAQLQLATRAAAPSQPEKEVQKAVQRRTVDHSSPFVRQLQARFIWRGPRDAHVMQPTMAGALQLQPPGAYAHLPAASLPAKFVHMAANKVRCSVNTVTWTPEGRRCITGAQTGELTLWSGSNFTFETILQAHEAPIRDMVYTHNGTFILSCDDSGTLKVFKSNLAPLKSVAAHKEACRAVTVCPTDIKFATCSDDSTVKVWDLRNLATEQVMTGHGGDARYCQWHPSKGLIASCSKDALVKLWDPHNGAVLHSLHGHKSTIMQVQWNANGNWLLTASRDQTLKVYDIRTMKELSSFRGHNRDVMTAAWHPVQEDCFASGSQDGGLCLWLVGHEKPQAEVPNAHEGSIWAMAFHPVGHILATGSGDYSTKFWCRNRPGDLWRDRGQRDLEGSATSYADAASEAASLLSKALAPAAAAAVQPGRLPPGLDGVKAVIPGVGGVVEHAPRPPPGLAVGARDMPPGRGRGSEPSPSGADRDRDRERAWNRDRDRDREADRRDGMGFRGRGRAGAPPYAGTKRARESPGRAAGFPGGMEPYAAQRQSPMGAGGPGPPAGEPYSGGGQPGWRGQSPNHPGSFPPAPTSYPPGPPGVTSYPPEPYAQGSYAQGPVGGYPPGQLPATPAMAAGYGPPGVGPPVAGMGGQPPPPGAMGVPQQMGGYPSEYGGGYGAPLQGMYDQHPQQQQQQQQVLQQYYQQQPALGWQQQQGPPPPPQQQFKEGWRGSPGRGRGGRGPREHGGYQQRGRGRGRYYIHALALHVHHACND